MSKSFGEIMAAATMAASQWKQKNHPQCPLCGEIMQFNGVAWFCYGGRKDHYEWLMSRKKAAFEYQESGGVVFWMDIETPPRYRYRNWSPEMQGVLIAVTENGWQFGTVRGENGVTNFRVTPPEGKDWECIPALKDGCWAEWTMDNA
jgi:hypothetical protein